MKFRDATEPFCPSPELIRDSELCSVQRVVPGRLLYVASQSKPDSTYAFKLDKLCVLHSDGSLSPYRGEPLSSLGVSVGKTVRVVGMDSPNVPQALIVAEEPTAGRLGLAGNSIGEFASRTRGFLKFWS
jgi:hypothetical protein